MGKELAGCSTQVGPPVPQAQGCTDTIVNHRSGSGKPGYPLAENIAMPTPDGGTTTVNISVAQLQKQALEDVLFDVPAGYQQVNSIAELIPGAVPQVAPQQAVAAPTGMAPMPQTGNAAQHPSAAQMMFNPGAQMAMQQPMMAQAQHMGLGGATANGMMSGMGGMNAMGGNQPASAPIAAPPGLGSKGAGEDPRGNRPSRSTTWAGEQMPERTTALRFAMPLSH